MPWIMLTKKLPTDPSPPKLSLHWATPWPVESRAKVIDNLRLIQDFNEGKGEQIPVSQATAAYEDLNGIDPGSNPNDEYFFDMWGKVPNPVKAWRINYKETDIRVWAHECKVQDGPSMQMWVFGMEGEHIPSHELVTVGNAKDAMLLRAALETDLQGIYDAAMIDGCTPEMAQMVALGHPVDDETVDFPPIGWYRAKHEFAVYYCHSHELTE
jgi:hypothetical protein